VVASSGHRSSNLNESDNYSFQESEYDHKAAYAQSKLANIYMANELDRRYKQKGLRATSIHPGGINANISGHIGSGVFKQILGHEQFRKVLKTPEQGAVATVLGKSGKYLEDCEEAKPGEDDRKPLGAGYTKQTYGPVNERRLWKDSMAILGMEDGLE
jgi:NAD(P)-dependent dehydrogenase (short-subunit alcohol dehydrogenase family)